MKNDKICINKSVMFIAVVGVILLGVVMATNYVNTQNLSTKSRAEVVADVTPSAPPPVVAGSTFALSELKIKASATIQNLTNMLKTSAALSNSKQLEDAKSAIATNVTVAEKALVVVKKETDTFGDLIVLRKTALEVNLAIAMTTTEQAQTKRDKDKRNLQQKENELNSNPDVAVAKKAVDDARKLSEDAVFALFSIDTSSIDPGVLAGLKSVVLTADTDRYITSLEQRKTLVDLPIFSIAQRSNYLASLASLTSAQAQYKSAKLKAFDAEDLRRINADINVLVAKLEESEKKLQDEKNKESVLQQMVDSIAAYEGALKVFVNSITETSPLPGRLLTIVLPNPNYGVNTAVINEINSGTAKVNTALLAANNAYDALDKAISEANTNKEAQVTENNNYCTALKTNYASMLENPNESYDRLTPINLDGSDFWAQRYYEDNCKKAENEPAWNGKYGVGDNGAKCYTATGLCKKGTGCNLPSCIERLSTGNGCIYKEVAVDKCIYSESNPKGTAPVDVTQSNFSCPSTGSKVYFKVNSSGKYYEFEGQEKVMADEEKAGGKKRVCVNKELTSESEIDTAKAYIAEVEQNAAGACLLSTNYSQGQGKYEYVTEIKEGMPATTKKVMKKYSVCYALGGINEKGTQCPNVEVADVYCQCLSLKNMGSKIDDIPECDVLK